MPSRLSMRPRISAAALLVKVTANRPSGATPSTSISQAARWVRTRVLPLPAPAMTSNGSAGAVTACRCASFRDSSIGVTSIDVFGERIGRGKSSSLLKKPSMAFSIRLFEKRCFRRSYLFKRLLPSKKTGLPRVRARTQPISLQLLPLSEAQHDAGKGLQLPQYFSIDGDGAQTALWPGPAKQIGA